MEILRDVQRFEPSGPQQSSALLNRAQRLVMRLSAVSALLQAPAVLVVLLALVALGGCATATTATTTRTVCAAWRPITYSGSKDTATTVRQVRVHNTAGSNLRCWPK